MSGATVTLNKSDEGEYRAEQEAPEEFGSGGEGKQVSIDWSYGPVKNVGYIDPATLTLKVSPSYLGIQTGTVEGNMKDGVRVQINYQAAVGEQRWYLKNGNEVWTYIDIKIKFDGMFEGDYKILSF